MNEEALKELVDCIGDIIDEVDDLPCECFENCDECMYKKLCHAACHASDILFANGLVPANWKLGSK